MNGDPHKTEIECLMDKILSHMQVDSFRISGIPEISMPLDNRLHSDKL